MNEFKVDGYTIVEDEVKHDDVVTVINDYYDSREICEYTMPIPETPSLHYTVVKEAPKNDKEYFDVNYAL